MMLIGIDPGSKVSGLARRNADGEWDFDHVSNEEIVTDWILATWYRGTPRWIAVEVIQGMGMPVAQETFDTCQWTGDFRRAAIIAGHSFIPVTRRQVRMEICNDPKATDSNIRMALINRFGGSREAAIGTKKTPGPLYGCTKHCWSALAVALTAEQLPKGT